MELNPIKKPALISAIIGPIQAVLGWLIAGALWPGFDHLTKTISDLAADDSPVKWVQSSFFILGGTLSLVTAVYATALALPGRIVIFIAGLTTYGLTIFATPTQLTFSTWHRVFAIATFILMSAWPLFSMRLGQNNPWVLRPVGAISATLAFTVGSVMFLSVWANPDQPLVGLWERVIAVGQVLYLAVVVVMSWSYFRSSRR